MKEVKKTRQNYIVYQQLPNTVIQEDTQKNKTDMKK